MYAPTHAMNTCELAPCIFIIHTHTLYYIRIEKKKHANSKILNKFFNSIVYITLATNRDLQNDVKILLK